MQTAEICPLTRESVQSLLAERCADAIVGKPGRRGGQRWPFRGTIEMWLPGEDGALEHTLATCLDLSLGGVGIRSDLPLECGLEIELAVHQPEVSFHGRATVRHCTPTERGDFLAGLEFVY